MAKFQILLADQEEDYISLLELRLLEHFGDVADIQLISDMGYFQTFFETPQKLDLLIINQELYIPELARHSIKAVIRLSESPVEIQRDAEGCVLYKYTGVKEFFDELAPYLDAGEAEGFQQESRLICVYSPVGGMGSTTLALGLSAAFAARRRDVLYLNTETVQSFQSRIPDCSDVLDSESRARLLRESGGERLGREAFGNCGFDYLLPFEHSIATYGITLGHLTRLAEEIQQSGRYQYIVVDCSPEFTQEKSVLMSRCSTVLLLVGQDRYTCARIDSLLRDINIRDTDKFQFVCNRYRADEENYLKQALMGRMNIVEYIPFLPAHVLASVASLGAAEEIMRLAYRLI